MEVTKASSLSHLSAGEKRQLAHLKMRAEDDVNRRPVCSHGIERKPDVDAMGAISRRGVGVDVPRQNSICAGQPPQERSQCKEVPAVAENPSGSDAR